MNCWKSGRGARAPMSHSWRRHWKQLSVILLALVKARDRQAYNVISAVGGSVAEWLACWTHARCVVSVEIFSWKLQPRCKLWLAWVPIAAATLSGNSLRQTVHTHCAFVHQAVKLVAALLRVVRVTAGLAESNGSLPPGLWLTSHAGWLPRTAISSGTLRSVIEHGLPLPFVTWFLNLNTLSLASTDISHKTFAATQAHG